MPSKDQLEEIGIAVCDRALELFSYADVEYDFCIQCVGTNIVFGGTNRVSFDPIIGFTAFSSHCTPHFIDKAQDMGVKIL